MGMKRPGSAASTIRCDSPTLNITVDNSYNISPDSYDSTIIPFPRSNSSMSLMRPSSANRNRPLSASSTQSSRSTLDTQRSMMSVFSNKSFSSINMPQTIGSLKASKRLKERENVLPSHTCVTFYNKQRSGSKATYCKRCSMIHNGKFANTTTHSVLASNIDGSLTRINKRSASPKQEALQMRRSIQRSEKQAARVERANLEQRQMDHDRLTNNIKTLIKYYTADVDKNIQSIRRKSVTDNNIVQFKKIDQNDVREDDVEEDVETNFYQKQSRANRIGNFSQDDLYNDEQILMLMEEYGVHCTPEVLEFQV
ncbi:hypothetical protein AKO1_013430 [Acrasis kona]|uniref:Uncharacterized protein n=1 Tax=Acrasis kona TaxID=1008807 RepID=A0AAW2ZI69_9EUKA